MKIKFFGRQNGTQRERDADLLLCIIAKVSQCTVEITDQIQDADLVIVYPYVVGRFSYRWRWAVAKLTARLVPRLMRLNSPTLRWLLGIGQAKVIFVSHENLDRPYWWMWIGSLLVESDIPRLTFWPKEIDSKGVRFPYWYNYVDWPSYPRENLYKRFGRLYQIEELMSPLKAQDNRMPYAVAIGSHYDYPRAALLSDVRKIMSVDCFGGMGKRFAGSKLEIMRKYKYAFCPENSSGYGYDTEKLPEAWVAGCIPVGIYLNPYSDFNSKLIDAIDDSDIVYKQPLLLKMPDLKEIEDYVRAVLE
jgi:uncharacterized protein YjhX (UPF0386 family)